MLPKKGLHATLQVVVTARWPHKLPGFPGSRSTATSNGLFGEQAGYRQKFGEKS